ncbi:IS3 family transposase [Lactobacillaceae bacterium Melli_B4]
MLFYPEFNHRSINWFNNVRISSKLKGLTPVEYSNQTLGLQ